MKVPAKRVLITAIVAVFLMIGAYFGAQIIKKSQTATRRIDQGVAVAELPPQPVAARADMSLLFFGDVFWGRQVDLWAQASPLKYAYPFSGLATFERERYDGWIANLECPVTDTPVSFAQQKTLLKFNCPPGYLPEAAKWFDVLSLSNNHTDNQQEVDGLSKTRGYLQQHGIQYFGHYDNGATDDICEVVSLPARLIDTEGKPLPGDNAVAMPVALCGYHTVFRLARESELAVIADYAKYLPTFVMPHAGAEYQPTADELKAGQFRRMVDYGADAVIGGHPHWVQNTEVYQGKLIVYSLGNFIFDQQFEPDVTRGIGIAMDISFVYDENLARWQELADDCAAHKDSCLGRAAEQGLIKPAFKINYDLVSSDSSGGLTKKAAEGVHQALLIRTNWADTLVKLDQ